MREEKKYKKNEKKKQKKENNYKREIMSIRNGEAESREESRSEKNTSISVSQDKTAYKQHLDTTSTN